MDSNNNKSRSPVDASKDDRKSSTDQDLLPTVFGRSNSGDSSDLLPLPSPPRSHDRHFWAFLELELKETQRAAFCNGTYSNYLNYLAQYVLFCDEYGYTPFPMKEIVLSMFAQFLSRKMKLQLIKAVLSGFCTVSTTAGFDIPQKQFPLVNLTLRGLGNLKQTPPDQAHPMTVRLLLSIRENLNLQVHFQATMLALFISCFCMLLCKLNVTPDKEWETHYMCREHLKRGPVGYLVTLYWTKTLQTGDRRLEYPLLEAPGCLLCLLWALDNMIK